MATVNKVTTVTRYQVTYEATDAEALLFFLDCARKHLTTNGGMTEQLSVSLRNIETPLASVLNAR